MTRLEAPLNRSDIRYPKEYNCPSTGRYCELRFKATNLACMSLVDVLECTTDQCDIEEAGGTHEFLMNLKPVSEEVIHA